MKKETENQISQEAETYSKTFDPQYQDHAYEDYYAGRKANIEEVEILRDGIQWALNNPGSIRVFDELKKLLNPKQLTP